MVELSSADELRVLRKLVEALQERTASNEEHAKTAAVEARAAHQEILGLRDQLAAAERDQQDLRTARARLVRLKSRGLLWRILNRG